MDIQYLNLVRERNPLIHNITNLVSAHFTANGLLALGASPMMADSPAEMAELAALSGAVVLNLGTPSDEKTAAMAAAGVAANRAGVPLVLDPVAVSASRLRRDTLNTLAAAMRFTAIRGNAGELAYLAGVEWQAKGVDAGSGTGDLAAIAREVAQRFGCVAVLSGAADYVSDGRQTVCLTNGTPLFPQITASGCLLSAVVGAFLAVAPPERAFQAACEAVAVYTVAGERAAQGLQARQTGSFGWRLLDALAAVTADDVARSVKIQAA